MQFVDFDNENHLNTMSIEAIEKFGGHVAVSEALTEVFNEANDKSAFLNNIHPDLSDLLSDRNVQIINRERYNEVSEALTLPAIPKEAVFGGSFDETSNFYGVNIEKFLGLSRDEAGNYTTAGGIYGIYLFVVATTHIDNMVNANLTHSDDGIYWYDVVYHVEDCKQHFNDAAMSPDVEDFNDADRYHYANCIAHPWELDAVMRGTIFLNTVYGIPVSGVNQMLMKVWENQLLKLANDNTYAGILRRNVGVVDAGSAPGEVKKWIREAKRTLVD